MCNNTPRRLKVMLRQLLLKQARQALLLLMPQIAQHLQVGQPLLQVPRQARLQQVQIPQALKQARRIQVHRRLRPKQERRLHQPPMRQTVPRQQQPQRVRQRHGQHILRISELMATGMCGTQQQAPMWTAALMRA